MGRTNKKSWKKIQSNDIQKAHEFNELVESVLNLHDQALKDTFNESSKLSKIKYFNNNDEKLIQKLKKSAAKYNKPLNQPKDNTKPRVNLEALDLWGEKIIDDNITKKSTRLLMSDPVIKPPSSTSLNPLQQALERELFNEVNDGAYLQRLNNYKSCARNSEESAINLNDQIKDQKLSHSELLSRKPRKEKVKKRRRQLAIEENIRLIKLKQKHSTDDCKQNIDEYIKQIYDQKFNNRQLLKKYRRELLSKANLLTGKVKTVKIGKKKQQLHCNDFVSLEKVKSNKTDFRRSVTTTRNYALRTFFDSLLRRTMIELSSKKFDIKRFNPKLKVTTSARS